MQQKCVINPWGMVKSCNLYIIKIQEKKKKGIGKEAIFEEILHEIFHKLKKCICHRFKNLYRTKNCKYIYI